MCSSWTKVCASSHLISAIRLYTYQVCNDKMTARCRGALDNRASCSPMSTRQYRVPAPPHHWFHRPSKLDVHPKLLSVNSNTLSRHASKANMQSPYSSPSMDQVRSCPSLSYLRGFGPDRPHSCSGHQARSAAAAASHCHWLHPSGQ